MIWVCKIHCHSGFLFQRFPISKLKTIVEGNCFLFSFWYVSKRFERKRGKQPGVCLRKEKSNQISGFSIDKRDNTHTFVSADHCVTFIVADSSSSLGNLWSFVNTSFFGLFTQYFSDFSTSSSSVFAFL